LAESAHTDFIDFAFMFVVFLVSSLTSIPGRGLSLCPRCSRANMLNNYTSVIIIRLVVIMCRFAYAMVSFVFVVVAFVAIADVCVLVPVRSFERHNNALVP
jgi:hypothetical protein